MSDAPKHPARYTPAVWGEILHVLATFAPPPARVLDPMAGTGEALGQLAAAGYDVEGIELEPEWAAAAPHVRQGDATALPHDDESVDVVVVSPAYGNRFADKLRTDRTAHTVRSYAQALGRDLSPGSGAALRWGQEYRDLHLAAWREVRRVLRPGAGLFVLNVSDSIGGGRRRYVADWHTTAILQMGFSIVHAREVVTPRFTRGTNAAARVEGEMVLAFRLREPRRSLL